MKLDPTTTVLTLLALALTSPAEAAPQYRDDDARDRIVFTDGDSERGRLIWRWDPEGEIHWLLPSGRTRQFDREDVMQLDLVTERLGGWLVARSPSASLDQEWALVQYAVDAGLDAIARAQAYHILSRDPSYAAAHEFLGHVRRGGRWLWAFADGSRPVPYEEWAARHADPGHPLELQGEHYVLSTTAEIGRAVDLLFDLERAYHEFHLEFGGNGGLRPRHVVERPLQVRVYANEEQFPPLTGAKRGYYLPGLPLQANPDAPLVGTGNDVITFYDGQGSHPRDFFHLAAQQLLYNTVLSARQLPWQGASLGQAREGAMIEIGFGYWFGSQFHGRPGYVERKPFRLDPADAALARGKSESVLFREQRKALPNLIGLDYSAFHKNDDALREEFRARAHAFFAYLMDPGNRFPTGEREGEPMRPAILRFLREMYVTAAGASSSKLDDALGTRLERLDEHYRAWLDRQ